MKTKKKSQALGILKDFQGPGAAARSAAHCLQICLEVITGVIKALAEPLENPLKLVQRGLTEFEMAWDGLGDFCVGCWLFHAVKYILI